MTGTEGEGLPTALMDQLKTVRIAMAGGFDSLNVDQTITYWTKGSDTAGSII